MSDDYEEEPEFKSYADEMYERNIEDAKKRKQEFEDAMAEHVAKWKVGMAVTDGKFRAKIIHVNQFNGSLRTTPPKPLPGVTDCFHGWDEDNMVVDENPPADEAPQITEVKS